MPHSGTAAACANVSFAGRRGEVLDRHAHELRECACREAEHLIAQPESGHALAYALHGPRQVDPWHQVPRTAHPCREPNEERGATHDMPVTGEYRRGPDAHEHLPGTGLWHREFLKGKDIRGAVSTVDDGIHGASLLERTV